MDDSSEKDISGLLQLPAEILEAVGGELPANDLLSLRLTCKEIEGNVFRVFTDKCFTTRTFVLRCAWNLYVLQKISTHPLFSKTLRRIVCVPARIVYPREAAKWNAWANSLKAENLVMGNEQKVEYFRMRKMYQDHRTFAHASTNWEAALCHIFENLAASESPGVALQVAWHEDYPRLVHPDMQEVRKAIGTDLALSEVEGVDAFQIKSQLYEYTLRFPQIITELKIPEPEDDTDLRAFDILRAGARHCAKADLTQDIKSHASLLRVLDLTVQFDAASLDTHEGLECFKRLLAASSNLSVLKLRTSNAGPGPNRETETEFAGILLASSLPKLEQADFDIHIPTRSMLHLFIKRHRSSLQEFQLYEKRLRFTARQPLGSEIRQLLAETGAENLQLQIRPKE